MISTTKVEKELPCQFVLLHKEAGLETPEISGFYPHIRNTRVLFLIETFIYNDGKAIFWDEI